MALPQISISFRSESSSLPVAQRRAVIGQYKTVVLLCHVSRGELHCLTKMQEPLTFHVVYFGGELIKFYSTLCVNSLCTWSSFFVISMNVSNKEISLWSGDLVIFMNIQKQIACDGTENGGTTVFPIRCRVNPAVPTYRN